MQKPTMYFAVKRSPADLSRIVVLQVRTRHAGPFAHHWLETETSAGNVTIGFGPATVPFIDAGQVSVEDAWGNTQRITGMSPLPLLGLPPLHYRYARAPGEGRIFGKPVKLTLGESEQLLQRISHSKFVGPYIPLFHDCRTFVCAAQAAAKRKSALPCYLFFKGYWQGL